MVVCSAMLECLETTLGPGMDRDTAVPLHRLRATSLSACLLNTLALGIMALSGSHAQALGLGSPQTHSVLGQPLLLSFPLILRAGEALGMDCVSAEVMAGTASLPASTVSVQLEGESETTLRAIRVLSSVAIDEPIVNVAVSLGCPVHLTRQFSVLMDPPGAQAVGAPAARAPVVSPKVLSPALRAALATSEAKPRALMGSSLSDPPEPARPSAAAVGRAQHSAAARTAAAQTLATKATAKTAAPALAATATSATLPQLRLEPLDAGAGAAADHAAAAAEAAMARLQTVESGLLNLQSEYRSNASKLSALRDGVAAGPGERAVADAGVTALTWGLGALSLLLGAGLAYVWRGHRRGQPGGESDWWGRDQQAVESVVAVHLSSSPSAERSEPQVFVEAPDDAALAWAGRASAQELTTVQPHGTETDGGAVADAVPAEPAQEELSGLARISQLMAGDLSLEPLSVQFIDPSGQQGDGSASAQASALLSVSVEELIDLEQQVDFFLVLGQDEAAVDLLQAQLRQATNGGAASALPYLKLMEICQQRGDALAFADIAGRFAVQFNSQPPAWELDLAAGRALEDYGDVILSLQSRWSDSGASMVSLHKLLSASGERPVGFDLPALRDLLLLYSVARDRSEHEVRGAEIDLFLPLEAKPRSIGDGGHPTGFDLMATMPWQSKPSLVVAPAGVDILLDDEPGAAGPSL